MSTRKEVATVVLRSSRECEVVEIPSLPASVLLVVVLVLESIPMAESTFDHERLAVYRLTIDSFAFSCQIAK